MTRRRGAGGPVTRRLGWALCASAMLHLLVAAGALTWPELLRRQVPPPSPGQEAVVEVVMGGGAEANGGATAPPASATPQPEREPAPAPVPQPPSMSSAETPALPAAPAVPPQPQAPPATPDWQTHVPLGDGSIGAAQILGDQLRPATGAHGNIPPAYPSLSRRLGEQGTAVLRLYIGANGAVDSVEVIQSSGYARLDDAAQAALARWHFTPAVQNGQPVASAQDLPITFRLQ